MERVVYSSLPEQIPASGPYTLRATVCRFARLRIRGMPARIRFRRRWIRAEHQHSRRAFRLRRSDRLLCDSTFSFLPALPARSWLAFERGTLIQSPRY